MSTQKDRRKAKKREKQKKKRDEARRTRGSRKPVGSGLGGIDAAEAASWPVGECWASADWHERGAHLHAIFTRRSAEGAVAASVFELDLAERGVVEASSGVGAGDAIVQNELIRRSSDDRPMVAVEPALVVKLVDAARRHGERGGHEAASGWQEAARLFGDVRPEDAPQEILCGTEEAPAPPEPRGEGFLATLKRRLGLGG